MTQHICRHMCCFLFEYDCTYLLECTYYICITCVHTIYVLHIVCIYLLDILYMYYMCYIYIHVCIRIYIYIYIYIYNNFKKRPDISGGSTLDQSTVHLVIRDEVFPLCNFFCWPFLNLWRYFHLTKCLSFVCVCVCVCVWVCEYASCNSFFESACRTSHENSSGFET